MSRKKRKGRVTAKLIIAPNPLLTTVCEPVEDGEDVSGIIRDMRYILSNSKHGVGLAAPQAGHLKRIIIVKESSSCFLVMINPEASPRSSSKWTDIEGCLSYPGKSKAIARYGAIRVNYTLEGGRKAENVEFENFPARIIQHEIDHLNGKCKVGEDT